MSGAAPSIEQASAYRQALHVLIDYVDGMRPLTVRNPAIAEDRVRACALALRQDTAAAAHVGAALWQLLAVTHQSSLYAESGVRSGLGFAIDISQRIGARILPRVPKEGVLRDALRQVFRFADDHVWVNAVSDEAWLELFASLPPPPEETRMAALLPVIEAIRVLSYRIAGTALDRELLRAEPELEEYESPFLAQNAELLPLLERERNESEGQRVFERDFDHLKVLLDQCFEVLDRVRRRARTRGISVRLTYLLARLIQLTQRLVVLLDFLSADLRSLPGVRLFRTLVTGEQTRHQVSTFIGDNLSLLARNVTDHASQHGEHYIADDRAAWFEMLRSAAGGGVIIACMAMLKLRLNLLHLPPLTEGLLFGLNYALGFVLIHLLGCTVATKQPAMTAAVLATTLEDSRPRDLQRMVDITRNVSSSQFIAIVGNVALAFPVAMFIAWRWPSLFGQPLVPPEKAAHMLLDVHPLLSASLLFAAVAGVGLFLSGIVAGYFDNRALYLGLGERIGAHPLLGRIFGARRAQALGAYFEEHHGAILGNVFFGFYLGLMGCVSTLTGLLVDIRHVSFVSANLGTALVIENFRVPFGLLGWLVVGVIGIALVNLMVSFGLALYVAMRSRQLGSTQLLRLAGLVLVDFFHHPLAYCLPPAKAEPPEVGQGKGEIASRETESSSK